MFLKNMIAKEFFFFIILLRLKHVTIKCFRGWNHRGKQFFHKIRHGVLMLLELNTPFCCDHGLHQKAQAELELDLSNPVIFSVPSLLKP